MAVQNPFFGKRDNDAFTSRNTLGSGTGAASTGGSPSGAVMPSSSVTSPASTQRQASPVSQDSPGSKLTVGPNIKLKGVEITDCDTLVVEGTVEATMDSRVIQIAEQGASHMYTSTWPRHAAFRGWYIPYELEQYHWAAPERIELLVSALQPLAQAAAATSGQVPGISTYFSQLQTLGSLPTLWSILLDRVSLRPMVQDGVGVAGLRNYEALAPLQQMLLERRAPFDLIVELFEQLPPTRPDGSDFQARTASFERVRRQWDVARDYGAQRVVAFAIDPWVLNDTPEARQLLREWKAAAR
jgi:hypothetical protein